MKLEFSRQIFEKSSDIKFDENPSSGSRVVPCGQTDGRTDMTKLIVAFRNSANAPNEEKYPTPAVTSTTFYTFMSNFMIIKHISGI